jgi:hypothetical protein
VLTWRPRFPIQFVQQLFASVWHATFRIIHPNRPPSCRLTGLNMLLSCRSCTFPLSSSLAALPPCALYSYHPNSIGISARLPCRHSPVHTARQLGRMDCLSLDYHCDSCKPGNMWHAKNTCEPESQEKEDPGECRDEWRKLLQQTRG